MQNYVKLNQTGRDKIWEPMDDEDWYKANQKAEEEKQKKVVGRNNSNKLHSEGNQQQLLNIILPVSAGNGTGKIVTGILFVGHLFGSHNYIDSE